MLDEQPSYSCLLRSRRVSEASTGRKNKLAYLKEQIEAAHDCEQDL